MVWTVFFAEAKRSKSGAQTKTVVFSFLSSGLHLSNMEGVTHSKGKGSLIEFGSLDSWIYACHCHKSFTALPNSKIWGVTFGEWWAFQAFPKLIRKDTQKPCFMTDSGHIENFFKRPKARQWKPQNYPDLPVPQILGPNPPVANISTNWTLSSKYRELENQG